MTRKRLGTAWAFATILSTAGCPGDDVPATTGVDGDSSTGANEDTTTGGITTVDGTTAVSAGMDSTGPGMDSTGPGMDSTGPGMDSSGGGVCGDGIIDAGEDCDDVDLGGEDCTTQGFDGGRLSCAADCTFDTSACTSATCGDKVARGAEACDGSDLMGQDCLTLGFDGGTLACLGDCTDFDTSGCSTFTCGNDMIEGMETCDGADLAGQDCVMQGFDGGTLGCAVDCMSFDTSSCVMFSCGNDTIEGMEVCDGTDVGAEDCVTQGFDGGTLGCLMDCTGYDTSACMGFTCDDEDIGSMTGFAVTSGDTTADDDDLDPSCGGTGGNDRVIQFTAPADGTYMFDTIGSGYDTKIALFSDCATEIACNDDIMPGFLQSELSLAMTAGQQVLVVVDGYNGAVGAWVLNITPPGGLCGNDTIEGMEVCDGTDLGGADCVGQGFDGGTLGCAVDCASLDTSGCDAFGGDCCAANGTIGCDDAGCTTAVCAFDPFCCDTEWDVTCANEALTEPACVGVGGSCPGAAFPCEDETIGAATGPGVTSGNTTVDDNDLDPSCGGAGGNDRVISFTATAPGIHTFDTFGSTYDTKLALYSDCMTEISCNDDAGLVTVQSELTLDMVPGQSVLIVVDGFNGATGDWILNVTPPAPMCTDEDIGGTTGPAVTSGDTTGDDDDLDPSCGAAGGNDRVISFTAAADGLYTFDTFTSGYDTKLALFSDCSTEIACNDDATPGVVFQSELSLAMTTGQTVLVVVDGYDGAVGPWVLNITANIPLACVDQQIAGTMGASAAAGTTVGSDDDLTTSCGGGGGPDQVISFVAPAAQDYSFDTFGSAYDTILAAFSDCSTETACNDDAGVGMQSQLTMTLMAGEEVLLAVDGFGGATGDYVLNIFGGDCCAANTTVGCVDVGCTTTICAADPFCCDTEWDGMCATAAAAEPSCAGVGGCP